MNDFGYDREDNLKQMRKITYCRWLQGQLKKER